MPTYEYRCRECGEHLEIVQAFTDDPLTVCPACEGPLRKVFNSVGIAFKGSGFYKTDSRSGSSASSSGSSDAGAGSSGGTSESSSSSDGGSSSSSSDGGSSASSSGSGDSSGSSSTKAETASTS
jgi:putative FmdB family regulatory protein